MANDDDCVKHVMAASMAENDGIELDRNNKRSDAIVKYEQAIKELDAAIALAEPNHSEDKPKLIEHKNQIQSRIGTLKTSPSTSIPVEDQIKSVQLAMAGASAVSSATAAGGGVKTMAAVAAVGAVGGAVVLGGTLGLTTIGLVGGAATAGYCATRQDNIGQAARNVGNTALTGVSKAQELNEQHQITSKLAKAGSQAFDKAKEVNETYGITSKVGAATSAAVGKAKEIEDKHQVTQKVASGLSKGLDGVTKMLGGNKSDPKPDTKS